MANGNVRPTRKALRAAGLLPDNQPLHLVSKGDDVPGQPALVSQVFGPVEAAGDRTLLAVSSVHRPESDSDVPPGQLVRTPVAAVEVSKKGIHVHAKHRDALILLVRVLAGLWNVFWLVRALREVGSRTTQHK